MQHKPGGVGAYHPNELFVATLSANFGESPFYEVGRITAREWRYVELSYLGLQLEGESTTPQALRTHLLALPLNNI
jgi:hypothetical protein